MPHHPSSKMDAGLQLRPIGISTDPMPGDAPEPDKCSMPQTNDDVPIPEISPDGLTFVKDNGTYRTHGQLKLRNNLLFAVGFLELANAGDFAANVWNEIPVPIHAMVLMAIGGTLALGIACFAIKDAILSWNNLWCLRAERRLLRAQQAVPSGNNNDSMTRTIDCLLDMNFRETGTEIVDRIGMDICMGFGAVVVGVGTYMAIGGANPVVFNASNLLSGYIGNAPCALYGVVNLLWSTFVWRRSHRHATAGSRRSSTGHAEKMLGMRTSSFQLHSSLNGITGAVAGAASLITATMWWGYVALAPCMVLSVLTNLLWRYRVGYNRPFTRQVRPFEEDDLVTELLHINASRLRASIDPSDPLSQLVSDPRSTACVIEFITRNQLFEEFCVQVLRDAELATQIFDTSNETITIKPADFMLINNETHNGQLLEVARKWMAKSGPKCFNDRERYLLEAFGCYLCYGEK